MVLAYAIGWKSSSDDRIKALPFDWALAAGIVEAGTATSSTRTATRKNRRNSHTFAGSNASEKKSLSSCTRKHESKKTTAKFGIEPAVTTLSLTRSLQCEQWTTGRWCFHTSIR